MRTVRAACTFQANALSIKPSDQIEQLDELIHAEGDGTAFFEKTHIAQGMQARRRLWTAQFFNDLADLGRMDWDLLRRRDFKGDPNDPGKMERCQAEALVHRHLPVNALTGLACHGKLQEKRLAAEVEETGQQFRVVVKPDWYF